MALSVIVGSISPRIVKAYRPCIPDEVMNLFLRLAICLIRALIQLEFERLLPWSLLVSPNIERCRIVQTVETEEQVHRNTVYVIILKRKEVFLIIF